MTFDPGAANEKAGLVILQSESHFYFIGKSKVNGQNMVQLFKGVPDKKEMELLSEAPLLNSDSLRLKIDSYGDYYNFSFAEKGGNFKVLKDHVDGKFLSTHDAGGFLGALYGMYATSSGKSSINSAIFKYLRYKGDDPVFK